MNFFCTEEEFEIYVKDMNLDRATVVKADIHLTVKEAKDTFFVDPIISEEGFLGAI